MWLCSHVKSVCSIASPIHQLSVNPLRCTPGLRIDRQQLRRFDLQLAALAGSQLRGDDGIGAVDLRAVPPVTVRVGVGRRPRRPGRRRLRHRCAAPSSRRRTSRRRGRAESRRTSVVAALVHEPVVHHELNPGRGQQIENRGRLKLVPGHQLAADERAGSAPSDWPYRETCARAARCGRTGGRSCPSAG